MRVANTDLYEKIKYGHRSKKKVNRMNFWQSIKRDRLLYLLLLPIVVYFIIFKYVPMYGTVIAFKDYRLADGIFDSKWVGLKHFKSLFSGQDFWLILRNTIVLSMYSVLFTFPMPIIISILLNEVKNKTFKKGVQSILYVPHFISWVVLGGMVIAILSPSTGAVNQLLSLFGIAPIYFLRSTFWWPVSYIAAEIWQSTGWGTIIYLAAITGIDPELYEATYMDGANKLQQMWHVTLPCIRGTVAIMLILKMGKVLDVGFEQVYILQNDVVISISDVISTYEYRIGLQGMQYSLTTALGLFKGLIGLILVTITNRAVKGLGESGLW